MSSATSVVEAPLFDRRYAYSLVGAFAFGWAIISTGLSVINPLLPLVRAEFDLTGTETGLLMWAFTLPYMLMQIPAGVLGDRLGAKRLLVGMTFLAGAALTAMGLWSYGLVALVAFAVLNRLGAGVYYPTVFGVAAATVPAKARGIASSSLVAGMALGTALGVGLAVPLAQLRGNDWRFPLVVFGLLTLLLPAIFQLLMRSTPCAPDKASGAISAALRDRSLVTLFVINFCSNYAFSVMSVWGPAFMSGERDLPLALAGFYVALNNLVGLPSGMVTGLLSDRIGRRRMTVLLFLAAGTALVTTVSFGDPLIILVSTVACGVFGKWGSDGVLAAWMGDHVTAKFAYTGKTVYGVNNTARMLGGLLAPLVTGVLLDRTATLATGFFVGAAVLCVAACLAPLVAERAGQPR